MPIYSFKCLVCKGTEEVVRPMAKSAYPVTCPNCGEKDMIRDLRADLFHTASDSYDNPVISDSMAVNISQIEEHKKAFPDIRITDEGQPIMENYAQHEDYMEKTGFIKHPGKLRAGPKKVMTIKNWECGAYD